MIFTIICIFTFLVLMFLYIWKFIGNPKWYKWPRWYTSYPTLKELKEIIMFKQKKKFYEEGYTDEPD